MSIETEAHTSASGGGHTGDTNEHFLAHFGRDCTHPTPPRPSYPTLAQWWQRRAVFPVQSVNSSLPAQFPFVSLPTLWRVSPCVMWQESTVSTLGCKSSHASQPQVTRRRVSVCVCVRLVVFICNCWFLQCLLCSPCCLHTLIMHNNPPRGWMWLIYMHSNLHMKLHFLKFSNSAV